MAKSKKESKIRPNVFVGSSAESLDVAYAIQENLEFNAEVTVWPQGIFEPSQTSLKSLVQALARSDFGVFVFTPDDSVRLRKRTQSAVRDNVIFELGLFIGKLGSDRSFIVIPNNATDLRIPTDLTGVTPGKYDPDRKDKNLQAALGPFCNQVRRILKKRGAVRGRGKSPRPRRKLPNVAVHSAQYGVGDQWMNVKETLMRELKTHGFARADNRLGGDPKPGEAKTLRLDFSYKGDRRTIDIPEKGYLMFPD